MKAVQRVRWKALINQEMSFCNLCVASYLVDKLSIEYVVVKDIERKDALYSSVPEKVEKAKGRLNILKESLMLGAGVHTGTRCLKMFWKEMGASGGKLFGELQ